MNAFTGSWHRFSLHLTAHVLGHQTLFQFLEDSVARHRFERDYVLPMTIFALVHGTLLSVCSQMPHFHGSTSAADAGQITNLQ
jgi:hypothetical protein